MNNKTILLTGSTSGIGKATVLELVKTASTLILPLRNLVKGEALKKELLEINPICHIDLFLCDLESIKSTKSCAKAIASRYKVIDIIINNAGILDYQCRFTADGLESHFQVNVLSQYIFNNIVKPLVVASEQGRIINVSSLAHKLGKFNLEYIDDQNKFSKSVSSAFKLNFDAGLFRNLLTFKLANELNNTSVTVNCLHPGAIKNTNLAKDGMNTTGKIIDSIFNIFARSPQYGSKTTLYLAVSNEGGEVSGKFWSKSKVEKPSELSLDMELADQLANKCKELTGV